MCFVCHEGDSDTNARDEISSSPLPQLGNQLLQGVCGCKGSLGVVHQTCIDEWVMNNGKQECASCGEQYLVAGIFHPARPPMATHSLSRAIFTLWHFVFPVLIKIIFALTTLAVRYIAVPIVAGTVFYDSGNDDEIQQGPSILETWLAGFVVALGHRAASVNYKKWKNYFPLCADKTEDLKTKKKKAFTEVEVVIDALSTAEDIVGVPKRIETWKECVREVAVAIGALFLLRKVGVIPIIAAIVAIAIVCRRFHRPTPLKSEELHRRLEIARERRDVAQLPTVRRMFGVYTFDVALFSFMLPTVMGFLIHYAFHPFALGASWDELHVTAVSIVAHWMMGACCLIFIVRCEAGIMMALFAPGIDFFVLRSIDISSATDTWDWVHAQLLDIDPLKVVMDLTRIGVCELCWIGLTAHLPFRVYHLVFETPLPQLPMVSEDWFATHLALDIVLVGGIIVYFTETPVPRSAIRLTRLLARSFGKLLRLERYLFDENKWESVRVWLDELPSEEELSQEPPPIEKMLVRRERWLALEGYSPKLLKVRVAIFITLFLTFSSVAPTLIFVTGLRLASEVSSTFPQLLALAIGIPITLFTPKKVGEAVLRLLVSLGYLLVLCLTPIVTVIYSALTVPLEAVYQQTYEWKYLVNRHVVTRDFAKANRML